MFSKLLTFITISIIIITLAACGTATPPPTEPAPAASVTPAIPTETAVPSAATVNGEAISLEEFQAEIERYKSAQTGLGKTLPDDASLNSVVLEDLIAQTLLAQGAAQAGFIVDEAMLQERLAKLTEAIGGADAFSRWLSANFYTEGTFKVALRRNIAAAWMRDQIIAGVPTSDDQAHIRQILFYNEERAREVLGEIQAGRTDFDSFAALVDPIARGDLGWFPRNYILEKDVEQAAFALGPDQVSDVITTDLGFHIIKVIAREKRELSPDALLVLQSKAVTDWVSQQRTQSKVVIAP